MSGNLSVIASDELLEILRLESEPYGTNAYMLVCKEKNESILIDAPGSAETVKEKLGGSSVKYILMTHGHMDHTLALEELHRDLQTGIAAHSKDAGKLPVKPSKLLGGGEQISCGKIALAVLDTPGHTPGSLCFKTGKYLFSGDTIFPGGPGKTASPQDFRQIVKSIETKIMPLPDETVILPGHGEPSDLKTEREKFNTFRERDRGKELCGDVSWLGS
ncbi:MAG: MBL fold metallo-hydrolase [Bacillota bacterium]